MNNLYAFIFIAATIIACNSNASKESSHTDTLNGNICSDTITQYISARTMLRNGILRIKADELQVEEDTVFIYNADNTIFGKIYSKSKSEEPVFIGQESLNIKAYYPDNYIIIFDGDKLSDGKYKVTIDGLEKIIPHKDGITLYEDWETHLKTSFIVTDSTNPLRDEPSEYGNQLNEYNYDNLSFVVIEINNDWAKVVCNIDCEGCPNNEIITGWLKWRKGNLLIVKLYYVC